MNPSSDGSLKDCKILMEGLNDVRTDDRRADGNSSNMEAGTLYNVQGRALRNLGEIYQPRRNSVHKLCYISHFIRPFHYGASQ